MRNAAAPAASVRVERCRIVASWRDDGMPREPGYAVLRHYVTDTPDSLARGEAGLKQTAGDSICGPDRAVIDRLRWNPSRHSCMTSLTAREPGTKEAARWAGGSRGPVSVLNAPPKSGVPNALREAWLSSEACGGSSSGRACARGAHPPGNSPCPPDTPAFRPPTRHPKDPPPRRH